MIFSEQLLTLMAIRIDCIPPNKRSLAEIALFLRDHFLNPNKKVNTRMPNPFPDFTYKAELIRVVDGDTLEVRIDCGFDIWHVCTLRLEGVNCPETKGQTRPAGLAAKKATSAYLGTSGLVVRTRKDPRRRKDSFRRWLAKVWVDGRDQELAEYLLATHNAVPFMVDEEK